MKIYPSDWCLRKIDNRIVNLLSLYSSVVLKWVLFVAPFISVALVQVEFVSIKVNNNERLWWKSLRAETIKLLCLTLHQFLPTHSRKERALCLTIIGYESCETTVTRLPQSCHNWKNSNVNFKIGTIWFFFHLLSKSYCGQFWNKMVTLLRTAIEWAICCERIAVCHPRPLNLFFVHFN